jgi:hypothetical protein
MSGGTQRCERSQNVDIYLSRIGLRGDRISVIEARKYGDEFVKLDYLNPDQMYQRTIP